MARKVLTGLNLTNELQLNGSAGSAGQVLISSGTGSVPAWSSAPGVGAMNYAQTQATKQSTISASGVTLVSASITTSGYPVQVLVTGDAENNSAGAWVQLQLYRGSTAIGKIIHVEGSAASENIPYALTVVDAPTAGTYTYSLKTANAPSGGTFNFGETDGPVLTAIELAGPKGDTGATPNAFTTISTPSGTSPVADSSTDTLTLTAGTGIAITGDSAADSIAIATNATASNTVSTIVLRDASGNFSAGTITATTFSGSGASLTTLNASNLSSGTVPGDRGVTSGSASASFLEYNGTTATAGQLDGGTTAPSGTTRLNYGGYLYATRFYGDGSNLTTLNASNLSSGTVPGDRGVTSGSASASFVEYNGTTATAGQFDGGTTAPSATTRLNYGGYLFATAFNRMAITAPSTGSTLAIGDLKTFTVNNTLTLAGTDSTTMTFPSTSSTVMTLAQPGTLTGSPTLRVGTATAGTAPLYFGTTSPVLLTTAVSGAIEYDGLAFYKTINGTTGRAVDVASHYYVSDGSYGVDHSASSTAKSIFGSATTGLTLIAGTTYEFELSVYVSITVVGTSSPAWSHSFLLTTVSGSPTTTIYQQIHTGSNTTSQATAVTPTSIRNINNATVTVLAATTTGSRHAFYTSKGIIRVTGTGSVEISPAATASATSADYVFTPLAGSYIKITPIGNGTVAGVGAWA